MIYLIETTQEFATHFTEVRRLVARLKQCPACQLCDEIMRNFITVMRLTEHGLALKPHEMTREGSIILEMLDKLFFTIGQNPQDDLLIKHTALSVGVWVARQGGELQDISLLVNAIATFANQTHQQHDLEILYEASLHILTATDAFVKADTDKRDSMRPWRLLNLNHCIIATRSNHAELIKQAYARFIQYFPEEAPAFFSQAYRRVQAKRHPAHIRQLVQQYYQLFSVSSSSRAKVSTQVS